jgi:23S rRNA (cytosine1962-C5)-methyltransferase
MQRILDRLQQVLNEHDGCSNRRAFHGRGHSYPGLESLCVDIYPPVVLVTLFADETPEGFEGFLAQVAEMAAAHGLSATAVQQRGKKGVTLSMVQGEMPEALYAVEDDLRYQLNIGPNQNIGFFPDIAPARRWLRERSADKKVLNLFAYTCAFSVAAMAGGARRVVNVDMSRSAMKTGRENHVLNFEADDIQQRTRFLAHEIFRSVGRLAKQGPYDIIVIDPPSYQPGSFVAKSDYIRLIRKLPRVMRKDCLVLACLNAPNLGADFLNDLFAAELPQLTFCERLPNSPDFPDADAQRSLKMLVFKNEESAGQNPAQ